MFFARYLVSLTAACAMLSQAAYAAPAAESRDVYTPRITYPHSGTVWYSGQRHNVTWDASSPPKHITNPIGQIWLRKGGMTTSVVLAKNFNLTKGHIEVTVPSVKTGHDYQLVLFGDSGNFSPEFTIHQ